MAKTILPSGEELEVTPSEVLRYMNPDGLRQLLRQERLRWNLKVNKDCDYYDNQTLYKFSGEVHNNANYQRMEIRTFPDNGANAGYAGLNIDSGVFGIVHNMDKWDKSITSESLDAIVNRVMIGAFAKVDGKGGYGLNDEGQMDKSTSNRAAALMMDPYDGRIYAYTNDDPTYVNNETRAEDTKIPDRAVARIADIPTRVDQLINDLDFVADPDYHHTNNNFDHSARYVLDNIDDRTFVYPEISKDVNGDYIKNIRIGLNGLPGYAESDGEYKYNTQPDLGEERSVIRTGDRGADAVNSYNKNTDFSGDTTTDGFLHGVFRSLEELEKVDLVDQLMSPLTQAATPGARRDKNFYSFDGRWTPTWYDQSLTSSQYKDSQNPNNMEVKGIDTQPIPFKALNDEYSRTKLYQWRYNRVDVEYHNEDITMNIIESGEGYKVGDILRWVFGDDSFKYEVDQVGVNGQIQAGHYVPEKQNVYDQDPSTNGVGIEFQNTSGVGHGAKLEIVAKSTMVNHATQIKNNLYAYVDITPQVRSDNTTKWSDINQTDNQDGKVYVRSTAAGPAFSGINSGKGGPKTNESTTHVTLYEHGGNATAGVHTHLFRYVIDTENPTWVMRDGIRVYTGKWVDQGPLGLERPCDIKALMFANADTNNFNNYYKFMLDLMFDSYDRNPDAVITKNPNAVSIPYIHIDQIDPTEDRRFTEYKIDSDTNKIVEVDITAKVIYINAATGVVFMYNTGAKNDSSFGYGYRAAGWYALAGAVGI